MEQPDKRKIEAAEIRLFKTNGWIYTLGQKRSSDKRESGIRLKREI